MRNLVVGSRIRDIHRDYDIKINAFITNRKYAEAERLDTGERMYVQTEVIEMNIKNENFEMTL